MLDKVEIVEAENYTAQSGKRYIRMTQRRCTPAPPHAQGVEYLTVLVTPNQGVELSTDTYVLVWQLF
jgi:hypothetical protein